MYKPITGCTIVVPPSSALAQRLAGVLVAETLRQHGRTAKITVRERRPGDADTLAQLPRERKERAAV